MFSNSSPLYPPRLTSVFSLQVRVQDILSKTRLNSASILYLDKLRILRQRAGFISLNRGEMSKAAELLMSGRTDIREILFLYPGIVGIRQDGYQGDALPISSRYSWYTVGRISGRYSSYIQVQLLYGRTDIREILFLYTYRYSWYTVSREILFLYLGIVCIRWDGYQGDSIPISRYSWYTVGRISGRCSSYIQVQLVYGRTDIREILFLYPGIVDIWQDGHQGDTPFYIQVLLVSDKTDICLSFIAWITCVKHAVKFQDLIVRILCFYFMLP